MRIGYLLLFVFCTIQAYSQKGFQWESKKDKIVIPFTFVDNLIIIPVEINNTKLNMLLDSGSEPSLIFSYPENDSISLYNTRKIKISGLGNDEIAEGIMSNNNLANINGYVDRNFELLIILDESLNFSTRMGMAVNGILGYSFFKNNVVEIDYKREKIILYRDRSILKRKKIKSFVKLPIEIVKERPYLDVKVTLDSKPHSLKLLIDTGLADGLWLFENDSIKCNSVYFDDILGEGIGGTVFGKRSRLEELQFSKFKFNSPLVSYPDTASYKQLKMIDDRSGSIGGLILKRFSVLFDFEESQIFLKRNSYYYDKFNYNMSGIQLMHSGVEWVKDMYSDSGSFGAKNKNTANVVFQSTMLYNFKLKPIFKISVVRKDSEAELAGVKEGDKLIKINGRNVSNLSKQKIDDFLNEEEGKNIELEIERKGVRKKFKFQLKKIL